MYRGKKGKDRAGQKPIRFIRIFIPIGFWTKSITLVSIVPILMRERWKHPKYTGVFWSH